MKKSYRWAAWMLGLSLLAAAGCRNTNDSNSNRNIAQQSGTVEKITDEDIKPTPAPNKFPAKIIVPVGTIGYRVDEFSWHDKLADGTKPAAGKKFLLVNLTVGNTGPKESLVATFQLADGKTVFPLSEKGSSVPDSLNGVKQLAKDERRKGVLVFEAPESKKLNLKLTAAPPLKDEMFIDLAPQGTATPSPAAKSSPQGITPEERLRRQGQ